VATYRLPRSIDTAIVGAGQNGLAMSWYLGRAGRDHIVLDRRELLGGGWRDRWDEFQLVSPNWTTSLPGFAYDGDAPDEYMARDEVAGRIARYADAIDAPVLPGTTVERVSAGDGGFTLHTDHGPLTARSVIVATGGFQGPRMPGLSAALPGRITQMHSHAYRRESDLPPGAVLIVGSGQTGVQLAEEFHAAGRRVYLAVGSAGGMARRYRGHDCFWWFKQVFERGPEYGIEMPTIKTVPDPRIRFAPNPHLSGHGGGHDTNLRRLAADGITLLGHLDAVDGERISFRPDLSESLARADGFFAARFQGPIESYIERAGLDAPPDDREPFDFEPAQALELNLSKAGISTVIWAAGYRMDYSWIDLPIFDEFGVPRNDRGVSEVPGLYFIGMLWLHNLLSASLLGVGPDSRHLAGRMGLITADEAEQVPV
jgi:putative flavoprotein involved in K+ transport